MSRDIRLAAIGAVLAIGTVIFPPLKSHGDSYGFLFIVGGSDIDYTKLLMQLLVLAAAFGLIYFFSERPIK